MPSCISYLAVALTFLSNRCWAQRSGPVVVGQTFLASTVDPGCDCSAPWALTSHGISEKLFTVDADGNIVGQVAQSVAKVSDLVWEVRLKSDYKFSDGTPVTAALVAAGLTELNTKNSAAQASLGTMTVTAPSDLIVRIESTIATHVMDAVLAEWVFVVYYKDSSDNFVFTGPYAIQAGGFTESRIDLTPNIHYDDEAPTRPTIALKKFSSGHDLAEAAKRNEVDIGFHLPVDTLGDIQGVDGQNVVSFEVGYHYMMFHNTDNLDLNVRQAIDLVIDREALVTALDGGKATRSLFPDYTPYFLQDTAGSLQGKSTEAAALLDIAGWTLNSATGKRMKDGEELTVRLVAYPHRPGLVIMQPIIEAALVGLGITVDSVLTSQDWTETQDIIDGRSFDLLLWAQNTLPAGDPLWFLNHFFQSGAGSNHANLNSATVDNLLDTLSNANHNTRVSASEDAQRAILAEVPVSNLVTPYWHVSLSDRVAGYTPFGSDYHVIRADLRVAPDGCTQSSVKFIVLDGDPELLALEQGVRANLAAIGIDVTTELLEKDDFNAAMTAGDFNLCFSETWGPPYDPNSYTKSWQVANEAHYQAIPNTTPEEQAARAALFADIDSVVTIEDEVARQDKWDDILTSVHASAINLPFSGKRNPAVLNKRLTGYTPGEQQFDYPLHTLEAVTGENAIVVAPGAQTGLFSTVGRLDPHTYRPNEFFANNWVYEGLVKYGANGEIEPSLAKAWDVSDISGSDDQLYTFTLRDGVAFHDGETWNCGVAKLNFDHVLAPPLTTGDWHGWYDLPGKVKNWQCPSGDAGMTFTLETTGKYYPLLQELSLIRPLRMLSPASFVGGSASDPLTQNSCHVGWSSDAPIEGNDASVTCAGITSVSGTGPWKYDSTTGTTLEADGETVDYVTFTKNDQYWGGAPSLDSIQVQRYADSAAVKAALIAGTLDAVVGSGVLAPADLKDLQETQSDLLNIYVGPVLQNRVIVMNGNNAPTNNIELRKAIVHAVDKGTIIDQQLAGFEEAEDSLFPRNAPYCDINLTPRADYDIQKATLLNCNAQNPPDYLSLRSGPVVVGQTFLASTVDPGCDCSAPWALTSHGISEKLFTVDADGNIVGQVAQSVAKVSDLVWEVRLKSDYKFSDGTPVTAALVAAGLTELNTKNSAAQASLGTMTVTAPSDLIVRIESTIATHVMDAVLAEWVFVVYYKDSSDNFVFTGPYAIQAGGFTESRIDLTPNIHYDDEAPTRPTIALKKFSSGHDLAEAAKRNEVDIGFHLPVDTLGDIQGVDGQNVVSFEVGYHYMMFHNTDNLDLNVRQAIDLVIDREALVTALDGGKATRSLFPDYTPYFLQDTAGSLQGKSTEAAALLDIAGWTLNSATGKRMKDGEELTVRLVAYPHRPGLVIMQPIIEAALVGLGITVDSVLTSQDWTETQDIIDGRSFDLLLWAQNTLPAGDPLWFLNHFFQSGAGSNHANLNSATVDNLLDTLSNANHNTRVSASEDAQRAILAEVPVSNLVTPYWHVSLSDRVAGYTPFGSDYHVIRADLRVAPDGCTQSSVKFIVLDGDPELLALEQGVRANLAAIGIDVTTELLEKDDFNAAMTAGDFNLCFSETWGPPYDPNSYTKSWQVANEAHYQAIPNTTPEEQAARAALFADIDSVVTIEDEVARQDKWDDILTSVHASAINLPFSGKRNPAVLNKRLTGYTPGEQQFDYPLHTLEAVTGENAIVVAPGAQTGLFSTVGRLDPHTYRPNEFFANNWVYEGLVKYGANGEIEPSLAKAWDVSDISGSDDQLYTFTLRDGVAFHDGETWNCGVAKLNFDHVLAPPLTTGDWHGWYDLPGKVKNWQCPSGDAGMTFTLETTGKYYPLLQELSLIRPLRMLSPASFVGGSASDPLTQNSCHVGWSSDAPIEGNDASVTCAGITSVSGTGPWKYDSTTGTTLEADGETVDYVTFTKNDQYWGGAPSLDSIQVQRYADSAAVKAALIAGTLDAVVGSGVLAPADLKDLQETQSDLLNIYVGPVLQNRVIVMNGNNAPTNNIELRKAIVHAVDKGTIIDQQLAGFEEAEDSLFPRNAPYCDINLTPRADYDIQKATLLNCHANLPVCQDIVCIAGTQPVASRADTAASVRCCEPILCNANEYVSDHVCTQCPDGEEHSAGQNASGPDSSCAASPSPSPGPGPSPSPGPSPGPTKASGNSIIQPMVGASVVVVAATAVML